MDYGLLMQIHASIETHEGTEAKEKFVLPNEYKIGAKLMSNSYSIVVSTERKILEKRKMK